MEKMSNQKLYNITTLLLEGLNFDAKRSGFAYLLTVIMICAKEPEKRHDFVSILDYVAEDFGFKGRAIRPSCRDAIHDAFNSNRDAWKAFNSDWTGDVPPIFTDFCRCVATHVAAIYKETC